MIILVETAEVETVEEVEEVIHLDVVLELLYEIKDKDFKTQMEDLKISVVIDFNKELMF
jgi:hypothetical protein